MRLLLHICCGPCSIHPVECLIGDGFRVDGFFYNPNIHPQEEYERRRAPIETLFLTGRAALADSADAKKVDVNFPDYNPQEYFDFIGNDTNKPLRCKKCWELRLRETARRASAGGYDAFTTTLLISPYQDHDAIKVIGEKLSLEHKVGFHYVDFRPGFSHSQKCAKETKIYRQKYCGCVYSVEHKAQSVKRLPAVREAQR